MKPHELADQMTQRLQELGDPQNAAEMAAYMKTEMPFFGVKSPDRKAIAKEVFTGVSPKTQAEFEALVVALWERPHREEKYTALNLSGKWKKWRVPASIPLYERLIREGQWWDFVDEAAGYVGMVLDEYPDEVWPTIDAWIEDEDMWIRRTAMLAQRKRKASTEPDRLFRYALRLADEDEFFIRKAIGWALREYAHVDADAVEAFLEEHRETFSNLTLREASKHIESFSV